ncbi:hypothetical protein [Leifsonia poae]|uniref:hypothetical protein n=1 Tax=Leifsonia poae TaxID=110933 RepID=UPI003D670879
MNQREQNDVDALAVRRASRIVGLQITIASGALVVAAIGVAFFFVLDQLRPAELLEKPAPGEHKIYIDSTEAMIAFVVVGVLAVAVAGTLSLVITRRAVGPLGRALSIQRTFVQDASHELRTLSRFWMPGSRCCSARSPMATRPPSSLQSCARMLAPSSMS